MLAPTYVVQHTYLGEAAGSPEMHHRRPIIMMANRIEDNPREADCSGRALATLVIAWIGAALVASVLLKWTHMWVALAVLTLLFLIACGYAAFDARRTQERAFARAANRQLERRRRREQQLESVSSGIDNFPEVIDPPEYQTYWVADSPPSYTAAVGTQTGSVRSPSTITPEVEEVSGSIQPPRLSNPPPYAVAVQSEPLFIPIIQQSVGIQNNDMNNTSGNGENMILQTSVIENGQTTSSHNQLTTGIRIHQDKTEEGDQENVQNNLTTQSQVPNTPQPPSSRTQYLTSIINSTFVRNMRRANNNNNNNNNQEQNNNSTLNDRQINNDTTNNQSINNDRNNINNSGIGPPPAYLAVTRSSSD